MEDTTRNRTVGDSSGLQSVVVEEGGSEGLYRLCRESAGGPQGSIVESEGGIKLKKDSSWLFSVVPGWVLYGEISEG